MFPARVSAERGSAVLEFIMFVVLGQMLVFAGALAISSTLTSKVELQILATNATRSIAMDQEPILPPDVDITQTSCSLPLVCLSLRKGSMSVSAVGYK